MEHFDQEDEPDPELRSITNAIIGAAIELHRIELHRELGPGHDEGVYQKALEVEFAVRGLSFFRQHPVQLTYKRHVVGEGRLDFLVAKAVIVEIKSVEVVGRVHTAQVLGYLRVTRFRLALLINFNVARLVDGVRRIAN